MNRPDRIIRTGGRSALQADPIIRTALLAQLAAPAGTLWLVSGWISDVVLVDNSDGAYDYLLGDSAPTQCRLADLLLMIAEAGCTVHVVTRPDQANQNFLDRLGARAEDTPSLHITPDPKVHEKTLCGPDWIITGSMNFTRNGLTNNKEQIRYGTDMAQVAQAHKDFEDEWGDNR